MKAAVALLGISITLSLSPLATAATATYAVSGQNLDDSFAATGTIEAVRQGTLGAQLSGRVLEVLVHSGDAVKAGQVLLRIEADDAVDAATAGEAAARGAAARLVSARADFERAQRLHAAGYTSVAAMQRSEAALRSAEAEAQAAGASAGAAHTRAGWRTVAAPYAGFVTDVMVTAGDLATPGKPLVAMYDPAALRVIVQVPESIAALLQPAGRAMLLPQSAGAAQAPITLKSWTMVSAVDPATHSVEVRAELQAAAGLRPGQFVQMLLPLRASTAQIRIPVAAVVHRSEVTAVYVIDPAGVAHLRQVRLGNVEGTEVTVLSGLQGGEHIAVDPVAAGRN